MNFKILSQTHDDKYLIWLIQGDHPEINQIIMHESSRYKVISVWVTDPIVKVKLMKLD